MIIPEKMGQVSEVAEADSEAVVTLEAAVDAEAAAVVADGLKGR